MFFLVLKGGTTTVTLDMMTDLVVSIVEGAAPNNIISTDLVVAIKET